MPLYDNDLDPFGDGSLITSWRFEDASVTSLVNEQSNVTLSKLADTVTFDLTGKFGQGLQVDNAVADEIMYQSDVGHPVSGSSPLSISFWAEINTEGEGYPVPKIVFGGLGERYNVELHLREGSAPPNEVIYFYMQLHKKAIIQARYIQDVHMEGWHFFTYTYDPATQENKLYINDSLRGTNVLEMKFISGKPYQLTSMGVPSRGFDQLMIFNKTLSVADIQQLMTMEKFGNITVTPEALSSSIEMNSIYVPPIIDDFIARYKFNADPSDTTGDYNGTDFGTIDYDGEFKTFDGVGDYVTVPTISLPIKYSVSVWATYNGDGTEMLVANSSTSDLSYIIAVTNTTIYIGRKGNASYGAVTHNLGSTWNTPAHIVVIQTASGNNLRCFINNIEQTISYTGTIIDVGYIDRIGQWQNADNDAYSYTGDLSDLRVYERDISKNEVQGIFDLGVSGGVSEVNVTVLPTPLELTTNINIPTVLTGTSIVVVPSPLELNIIMQDVIFPNITVLPSPLELSMEMLTPIFPDVTVFPTPLDLTIEMLTPLQQFAFQYFDVKHEIDTSAYNTELFYIKQEIEETGDYVDVLNVDNFDFKHGVQGAIEITHRFEFVSRVDVSSLDTKRINKYVPLGAFAFFPFVDDYKDIIGGHPCTPANDISFIEDAELGSVVSVGTTFTNTNIPSLTFDTPIVLDGDFTVAFWSKSITDYYVSGFISTDLYHLLSTHFETLFNIRVEDYLTSNTAVIEPEFLKQTDNVHYTLIRKDGVLDLLVNGRSIEIVTPSLENTVTLTGIQTFHTGTYWVGAFSMANLAIYKRALEEYELDNLRVKVTASSLRLTEFDISNSSSVKDEAVELIDEFDFVNEMEISYYNVSQLDIFIFIGNAEDKIHYSNVNINKMLPSGTVQHFWEFRGSGLNSIRDKHFTLNSGTETYRADGGSIALVHKQGDSQLELNCEVDILKGYRDFTLAFKYKAETSDDNNKIIVSASGQHPMLSINMEDGTGIASIEITYLSSLMYFTPKNIHFHIILVVDSTNETFNVYCDGVHVGTGTIFPELISPTGSSRVVMKEFNDAHLSNLYLTNKAINSDEAHTIYQAVGKDVHYKVVHRLYDGEKVSDFDFINTVQFDYYNVEKVSELVIIDKLELDVPRFERNIGESDYFNDGTVFGHWHLVDKKLNDELSNNDFSVLHLNSGREYDGVFGRVYNDYFIQTETSISQQDRSEKSISLWMNVDVEALENNLYTINDSNKHFNIIASMDENPTISSSCLGNGLALYREGEYRGFAIHSSYAIEPISIIHKVKDVDYFKRPFHIVVSMSKDNFWSIYINGKFVYRLNNTFANGAKNWTAIGGMWHAGLSESWWFGNYGWGGFEYIQGTLGNIENVREFDKCLNDVEAYKLYMEGLECSLFRQHIEPFTITKVDIFGQNVQPLSPIGSKIIVNSDVFCDGSTKYAWKWQDDIGHENGLAKPIPLALSESYQHATIDYDYPTSEWLYEDSEQIGYLKYTHSWKWFAFGVGLEDENFSVSWSAESHTDWNDENLHWWFGLGITDMTGYMNDGTGTFKYDKDTKTVISYSVDGHKGVIWDDVDIVLGAWNYFTISQRRISGWYECALYVGYDKYTVLSLHPMFPKSSRDKRFTEKLLRYQLFNNDGQGYDAEIGRTTATGGVRVFNRVISDNEAYGLVNQGVFTDSFDMVQSNSDLYTVEHDDDFIKHNIAPNYIILSSTKVVDLFGDGSGKYLWQLDGHYQEREGNATTVRNGTSYSWVDGQFMEAYSTSSDNTGLIFNLNDVIDTALYDDLKDEHSLSMFFKGDGAVGNYSIYAEGNDTNLVSAFRIEYLSGKLTFTRDGDFGFVYEHIISELDLSSSFHHIVVTKEYTSMPYLETGVLVRDEERKIYLGEVLLTTIASKARTDRIKFTINKISIGKNDTYNNSFGGNILHGSIDQIRLFDRVLTIDEIEQLSTEALAPKAFTMTHLIEELSFVENDIIHEIEEFNKDGFSITQSFKLSSTFYRFDIVDRLERHTPTIFIKRIEE